MMMVMMMGSKERTEVVSSAFIQHEREEAGICQTEVRAEADGVEGADDVLVEIGEEAADAAVQLLV